VTRRWLVPAAFAALCLVQAAIPVSMIARYERTLQDGTAFKVRALPVDPVDPFRGRYVVFRLGFEPVPLETSFAGPVWVELVEGADGFAKAGTVSRTRPTGGHYVQAQAIPLEWGAGAVKTRLELPHDRYYMEEAKASRADAAARAQSRPDARNTWVTLRVRDGVAAVEHLWIDGVTVEEYLRRQTTR
jgi:uncharacterized membrane-anchored protein